MFERENAAAIVEEGAGEDFLTEVVVFVVVVGEAFGVVAEVDGCFFVVGVVDVFFGAAFVVVAVDVVLVVAVFVFVVVFGAIGGFLEETVVDDNEEGLEVVVAGFLTFEVVVEEAVFDDAVFGFFVDVVVVFIVDVVVL